MPGEVLLLPFRPALDANAIPIVGAKLEFYVSRLDEPGSAPGTTMPQAVYADEALTVSLGAVVEANSAGVWPTIYLDQAKIYRVVLRSPDGEVLRETDPYVASVVDNLAPEIAANAAEAIRQASLAEGFALLLALLSGGYVSIDSSVPPVGVAEGEAYLYTMNGRFFLARNVGGAPSQVTEFATRVLIDTLLAGGFEDFDGGLGRFLASTAYPTGTVGNSLTGRGRFISDAPYNALMDGSADATNAFNSLVNDTGVVMFGPGRFRTDAATQDNWKAVAYATEFIGANRLTRNFPQFGGTFQAFATTGENCIVGVAHNNRPSGTLAFPTGVTGYGRNDSDGNTVFGIFGRVDQYGQAGCVTNELNSFNWSQTPASEALPPDRGFGTSQQQPIAVTVAAGGSMGSSIGIHICREGEAPQSFLTGIFMSADAIERYGLFIDAEGNDTYTSAVLKHGSNGIALRMNGVGPAAPGNAVLIYTNSANEDKFVLRQSGKIGFSSGITQADVGTQGAAEVLPSNPTGYLQIEIDGTQKVIPYYEAA